ncbi:hypothetical protein [Nocardioides convexus]|uniref:hypothetical protein n=1 Tax=Nocardioides convexus TaxID=2712224 RepID=UPI002418725C|nr:hypothetical protein [Nocardioides convexus]
MIPAGDARGIAGREVFAAAPAEEPAPGAYEIGEEHPDVGSSDALFEARQALEPGRPGA